MGLISDECVFCGGKIDVPCFYGAKLRCGCGKAVVDAPASPAQSDAAVDALLALLRKHGVSRFGGYGISVSFHGTAKGEPQWPSPDSCPYPGVHRVPVGFPASRCAQCTMQDAPPTPPDEEACTCGHKILTDHSPTGCLHGCDIETCGRQGTAGDDA